MQKAPQRAPLGRAPPRATRRAVSGLRGAAASPRSLRPATSLSSPAPASPHLAFVDVGVAVAAGAEWRGGVVDVDRPEPLDPNLLVGFVEHRAEVRLVGDVVALDEEVAGIETEAEAGTRPGQLDQLRGL